MIYCYRPSIENDNRVKIGKPIKDEIFQSAVNGILNYKGREVRYNLTEVGPDGGFRISIDNKNLSLTNEELLIFWTDQNGHVNKIDTINTVNDFPKTDFKWLIKELYRTDKTQDSSIHANHKPYLKITDTEANILWQQWIINVLGRNSILYGPPGTGKTFHGNILANEISAGKEKQLNITFHQSMTYEDMIEGIKPVLDDKKNLKYEVVDGSIKKFAYEALAEYLSVKNRKVYSSMKSEVISRYHDVNYLEEVRVGHVYRQLIDEYIKIFDSFPMQSIPFLTDEQSSTLDSISSNPTNINKYDINALVSGIFNKIDSLKIALNGFIDTIKNNHSSIREDRKKTRCNPHKDSIARLLDNLILLFDKSKCFDSHRFLLTLNISLTINQKIPLLENSIDSYLSNLAVGNSKKNKNQAVILATSARELLNNLSEVLSESSEIRKKILLNEDAIDLYYKGSCNNYVILIDEINRGNVSNIFGELITLLEQDKRLCQSNELFIKLPYSAEEFILPPNLFFIGTMNTADRSVEALDTALRRRFVFKEMKPDYSVLEDVIVEEIYISEMLRKINEEISKIKSSRDYEIGHAYFWPLKEDPSLDKLKAIFANSILPLLKEYFYGDYSSIKKILKESENEVNPIVQNVSGEFYDVRIENIDKKDANYFVNIYTGTIEANE